MDNDSRSVLISQHQRAEVEIKIIRMRFACFYFGTRKFKRHFDGWSVV